MGYQATFSPHGTSRAPLEGDKTNALRMVETHQVKTRLTKREASTRHAPGEGITTTLGRLGETDIPTRVVRHTVSVLAFNPNLLLSLMIPKTVILLCAPGASERGQTVQKVLRRTSCSSEIYPLMQQRQI